MAVSIKIQGDGLSYDGLTSGVKAGQIITFLMGDKIDEKDQNNVESGPPLIGAVSNKNKSPRQAIIDSQAKTNPQKILALASYWCELGGTETFNPADLRVLFRKAGEPEPKNFTRDLKSAIALNYIYEGQNTGEYSITETGQELLKSGFTSQSPVERKSRKSDKPRPVKVVSDDVKSLEFESTMDGFPDYHNLDTKAKKILWIVNFAQMKKIDSLLPAEVEYIADKLNDDISTRAFKALNVSNISKGYIKIAQDKTFKILQKGIDFLKSTGRNE